MKRRGFITSLSLLGGAIGLPVLMDSCQKEALIPNTQNLPLKSVLASSELKTGLENKLSKAVESFKMFHSESDFDAIHIVSALRSDTPMKIPVEDRFGCSRKISFVAVGILFKDRNPKVTLNLPKLTVNDDIYYLKTHSEPLAIDLPTGIVKKDRKPFHYILDQMLSSEISISKA